MNSEFAILGIALGLGLLVGLQRERLGTRIAGIRTFSLITLFGALTGLLSLQTSQAWLMGVGLLSVAILMAVANHLQTGDKKDISIGQTTEIAALMMYVVGAYLAYGNLVIGVVIGAAVAILLYLKEFFTEYVSRLGEKDFEAIMIFVAVTLVILPILPAKTFGPYNVLNAREIWLMVVLIVGISVSGYFAYKWLGSRVGTGLNGIFGGLISSTATTVTYSRLSKEWTSAQLLSSFIVVAASAVSFLRVIIEIAVVAPQKISVVVPPILIVASVLILISAVLFFRSNKIPDETAPDPKNPAQFKTAIVFAFLYAVILVIIAFVKDTFGNIGLYAVSILSGLTDMDAITLSLANTINDGGILPSEGWRFILVAGLSNLMFKGGLVITLGHTRLKQVVLPAFSITLVVGILVLIFW